MKKMINILLTASMLISCIAVPLAASAAEPQTAIVQENIAEENIKISEKLKEDIDRPYQGGGNKADGIYIG